MKRFAKAFVVAVSLGGVAPVLLGGGGAPCVPEGGTVDVSFPNPDPGPFGTLSSAEAMEQDPGPSFTDDSLGPATIGSSTTTIPISNDGGRLSGPSGESGDGPFGSPCLEVYIVWSVIYSGPGHSWKVKSFGSEVSAHTGADIYFDTLCSAVIQVCPC